MRCGGRDRQRRMLGMLMTLGGALIIFLCLPMQFFLIGLGVLLAAVGLALLR